MSNTRNGERKSKEKKSTDRKEGMEKGVREGDLILKVPFISTLDTKTQKVSRTVVRNVYHPSGTYNYFIFM